MRTPRLESARGPGDRVSVVLATYNGAQFLQEQLASLVLQTRPPDEVVVVDDSSFDGTADLLRAFAAAAPFDVELILRGSHLGTWATFEEGLHAATGDILVICDQDDRWRADKLEVLANRMAGSAGALMAFSDARLINAGGALIGQSRWRIAGFSPRLVAQMVDVPLCTLLSHQAVSGCTLALRAEMLPALLPFPTDIHPGLPTMMYDRWISLVAAAAGPVITVPEALVDYRIHRAQQIGIPALSVRRFVPRLALTGAQFIHRRAETVQRLEYHLAHLEEIDKRLVASGLSTALSEAVILAAERHLRFRSNLSGPRVRRVPAALRELRRSDGYRRFSLGPATALADVLR